MLESKGIPRPIGIVQLAVPNVTIVENWGIGLLFATLLPPQEKQAATQIPAQIRLSKPELTRPSGPSLSTGSIDHSSELAPNLIPLNQAEEEGQSFYPAGASTQGLPSATSEAQHSCAIPQLFNI